MRGHFLRAAAGNGGGYDPDAQSYITAVEAADAQSLEVGVKDAYNDFVVGCKSDGIWTAIKASCIMAGARTLAGALVPLVGAAPTPSNFLEVDYNRETGLVSSGANRIINTNRSNNADPQDSRHLAVYISQKATVNAGVSGTATNNTGGGVLYTGYGLYITRMTNNAALEKALTANPTFFGASRSDGSSCSLRADGTTTSAARTSATPVSETIEVFRSATQKTNARLSFYSIGEALDLALFDARVTTLMADIAAALP